MATPKSAKIVFRPADPSRGNLADGREILYFFDSLIRREEVLSSGIPADTRDLPKTIQGSEIRVDPFTGERVTYASHRMNRTHLPPANLNPLAPTVGIKDPTEIPAADYDVVVFENRFPSYSGERGGRCEVVVFSPDPTTSFKELTPVRIRTIIDTWIHRTQALQNTPGVAHVFPFENRGEEIGVTLHHPHGQIYAYPFVPPRAKAIATRMKESDTDIFADVLDSELATGERIITTTESWVVFTPCAAKWPVEVVVVPKRAVPDFTKLNEQEILELTAILPTLYATFDNYFEGLDELGYIAAWNQAPHVGEFAGLGRLHLQLFSLQRAPDKMKFLAGSESGMGAWISDTSPETIAARLRQLWAAIEEGE